MTALRVPMIKCEYCTNEYLGACGPDPYATAHDLRRYAQEQEGWTYRRYEDGTYEDVCDQCLANEVRRPA